LYKNFISSQDASTCTFTPSCSEYAILAIKKQGVIPGMINFFDRFSRCNGLSPENYSIDLKKGVLIDPPRDFKYEILE
jgi:putative membrane protein insertion efficiency factor